MTQSDDNRIVANLVAGSMPIHSTIQARDIPVQSTLGIVPSATTERKGIIRIATNEEAQEGIANNLAITPYTLNLVGSQNYGATLTLDLNTETYELTATLNNANGEILSSQIVDFPNEYAIVSIEYDEATHELILTLENGTKLRTEMTGLQSEITNENPLNADLVEDSTSTNKFVTTSEKAIWNNKVSDVQGEGIIDVSRLDNVVTIRSTTFVFEQAISSDTWVINHNLDKFPSIYVVDTAGHSQMPDDIEVNNMNTITVRFLAAFSGFAYLN